MRRNSKRLAFIALAVVVAAVLGFGGRCALKFWRQLQIQNQRAAKIIRNQERLIGEVLSIHGKSSFDYTWADTLGPYITHALGGIDGHIYTNSREAFEASYHRGARVFEVDLRLTSDLCVVCCHDEPKWRKQAHIPGETPFTVQNFRESRLYGKYTPLTLTDLIDLMVQYPDVYIITDSKYTDRASVMAQFSALVACASNTDAKVLDRIIPQIYNENMYAYVMEIYPFRSMVYTVYATHTNLESTLSFCQATGVGVITMPISVASDKDVLAAIHASGVRAAFHTLNDAGEAEQLLREGVDLLYTDTLP